MPDGEGPFPLVIFIHGFKGFMDWGPFPLVAKQLAVAGCMVVRFNGSHNGTTPEHLTTFADPEAFGRNTFSIELDDLGRVLDWSLAELPVDRKRIALLGHSRGGGLAICKAAEDPRVTRLVTWAAVHSFDHFWTPALLTRWQRDGVQYVVNSRTGEQLPMYITLYDDFMAHHARFDILTLASHISIPWLIIHGTADEAVKVEAAHQLHLTTSATMMFGHIETNRERMDHFVRLREVQARKPASAKGFLAFIPWPFQDEDTMLKRLKRARNTVTGDEYVRMIAMSRIMLPNIINVQASWLTVGKSIAQVCLHAGANDFGSIMIEENVVSAAGAPFRFTANGIQQAIREAGFVPQLRNQQYEFREIPATIEQQTLNHQTMVID